MTIETRADGGADRADIPGTLAGLKLLGDRPALTFYRGKARDGHLTYRELFARIEQLASVLHHEAGVERGDRMAVLSPNRLEIPVLVLALMRLGALVVPLNPTASSEDWDYILSHSRARGLAVTRELEPRVSPAARPPFTLFVEDLFTNACVKAPPSARGSLEDEPAVVLYTSGTTGQPKGVTLRQRNLVANARSMAKNFGLSGTTQLAVLPLYHAHAFGFGLMSALVSGGHLVFTERLEPFTWMDVIRAESVEVTSVVPSLLPMLLAGRVSRAKAPTLRHMLVSSAPLALDVARDFEEKTGIPLIQGWGLSEYTNFACCMPVGLPEAEHEELLFGFDVPSIGPALAGTEVKVASFSGEMAKEGERGEMMIRGPSTMAGYLDDPAATERTIDTDGWLRTGDLGFFRMSGGRPVYFIAGRIKEIIIRDAEKYSPLALERKLIAAIPELSQKVVILGFLHREHGEEIGAYIEQAEIDSELVAKVRAALDTFPPPERPKVVLYGVAPIPRTHTGKIQRRKMQPWFATHVNHRGAIIIEKAP